MIKTWITDVSPLLDVKEYQRCHDLLPIWRKDKADKLRGSINKAQSVGVWMLWMQMKEYFSIDDTAICSFSHSGDFAICSAEISGKSFVKLGCDIEKMRERDDFIDRFAKRFFSESEYQAIHLCNTLEEKRDMFYRIWVLKESFVKATGKGLAVDTRGFEICLKGQIPVLNILDEHADFGDGYKFYELEPIDLSYKVGLCTTATQVDTVLEHRLIL